MVFTQGLPMPHVWMIALLELTQALQKPWADPKTTDTGRLVWALGTEILDHVSLSENHRYAINGKRTPIGVALRHCFQTDMLENEPFPGIVITGLILKTWYPDMAHPSIDSVVTIAALHTIIDRNLASVKQGRTAQKSVEQRLKRALYRRVRVSPHAGSCVHAVVGSETLPMRWSSVGLTKRDVACLHMYNGSDNSLMDPAAVGMVAFAVLKTVNPNQSRSVARKAVREFDPLAALALANGLTGTLQPDDVLQAMRQHESTPFEPPGAIPLSCAAGI